MLEQKYFYFSISPSTDVQRIPMPLRFIEPTKRYADIIIPQGGENLKGIGILCKYVEGLIEK